MISPRTRGRLERPRVQGAGRAGSAEPDTEPQAEHEVTPVSPPRASRRLPLRLLVGLIVPLIAFLVLLQALGNATAALAITDAVPVVGVLAFGIWRRRVEPVALIPAAVFTLALILSITFGGSALPLELRRAVFPGAVGLACLISLVARRPLLLIAAAKLGRTGKRGAMTTLTFIVGITGLLDAAAQIVLALVVSTAVFAELARLASYTIIGGGLAVCAVYLRWSRARTPG
jgi:hypothetical protein